jgi:hypothetical protein
METPKEYYYTYYSYEEWGRGYFGSRGCKCLPEEDINYFGSFKDKAFKPTQKIIFKSDYATREEAYADEIILQEYYKVVENPHFANRAYQTSTKFCIPTEERKKISKRNCERFKEEKIGIFSFTPEEKKFNSLKGVETCKKLKKGVSFLSYEKRVEIGKSLAKNKKGIHSLTKEQRSKIAKKNYEEGKGFAILTKEQRIEIGRKNYKNGVGLASLTKEQKSEIGKKTFIEKKGVHSLPKEETIKNAIKGGKKLKELGVGIHAITKEKRREIVAKTNSQKWMCLETGFITNAGTLSRYQRARGIDTTKRIRIE